MTSNLGSDLILEADTEDESQKKMLMQNLDTLLKKSFRPEFLNRIDEIVMFNKLGIENIKDIVIKQLDSLQKRVESDRITLEYDQSALDLITKKGYDPNFGARPVKRAVQDLVSNSLSMAILEGTVLPGSTLVAKAKNDSIEWVKK